MEKTDKSGVSPFRFENPRQERIHRRLLLVGQGPASFYRDACRLMGEQSPLASTTHLVAHLLREIESGLRDVLETVADQSMRLKKGAKGEEKHRDEIRAILKELEVADTDSVAQAWLRLPGSENEYGLAARAHRDALSAPRPLNAEFRGFWDEIEAILDGVLEKFEAHYVAWHKQIDLLALKTSPTQADAEKLRLRTPNNLVAFGYFFNQLSNAAWLQPLFTEGLFNHPPEPDYDEERGTIGLWAWPQSRYLARMAGSAPDEVLNIILAIPDTKNTRVHLDFAEAALSMPADLAARLVPKMKTWGETGYGLLLPKKLGEFMEKLAQGGQTGPALELASSLLGVTPDPAPPVELDEVKKIFAHREPRARFDFWEYGEILKNNFPKVVEKSGGQALSVLCDLLEEAVRLSTPPSEKRNADDFSRSWRRAVEDHVQNSSHDVKDYLVAAVRDAAEQIARSDPHQVPILVRSFRKRRLRIFLRLAHHILRVFPEAEQEMVERALMCRELLNKAPLWHEYALLLRGRFRYISASNQAKILTWIERGPDPRAYKTWHERSFGKPATDEQAALYARGWKRDRLALISEDLPDNWRLHFSELTGELGPSEHPEFAVYTSGGSFGYRSPEEAKDLTSLNLDEIVEFLRTWKPGDEWMAPSPEGLGRRLTSLVVNDFGRFAEGANKFRGLDPTYVRSVIHGLEESAKKNAKLNWSPVIQLCAWVVEQPREIPGRDKNQREADPDWGGTLKAISSLLQTGLESESNGIPVELRDEVWSVLEHLAVDPEPTCESEAEYIKCNMDPATMSLNTERPSAMHAVIAYAFWVKRNSAAESKDGGPEESWFERMPEARKVLNAHLDSTVDRSIAVRSVYGQYLPWLVALDKCWVTQNISRLFPPEPGHAQLRKAAWDSYLVRCQPSGMLLGLLREEYMIAIGQIPQEPAKSGYLQDPSERLAEHLFLLYGWGKLELSDTLLQEFFAKAPDRISGHGFHQIGFSLYQEKGTVPPEVTERFKALWKNRLEVATTARDHTAHVAELSALGWWFASDKLDPDWGLARLEHFHK